MEHDFLYNCQIANSDIIGFANVSACKIFNDLIVQPVLLVMLAPLFVIICTTYVL